MKPIGNVRVTRLKRFASTLKKLGCGPHTQCLENWQ